MRNLFGLILAAMLVALSAPAQAGNTTSSVKESQTLLADGAVNLPRPNLDMFSGDVKYVFSTELNSETMWRGISLTNHRPGAVVRGEVEKGWFYVGGEALNVTLPTLPVVQLDVYGGVRPKWGPVTFDFGVFYYGRPGNQNQWFLGGAAPVLTVWTPGALPTTPLDQSFVEAYGKSTWAINDYLTLGSENYYTPNWAGYNAHALYSGGNAKLTLPGSHASLSGAFGHYFLGMGDATYGPTYIQPGVKGIQGFKLSTYNTWNIGASYDWNSVIFDVRYWDTTLTEKGCFVNVANPTGNLSGALWGNPYSNWCEARVVGSIKVNLGNDRGAPVFNPASAVVE